jgi:hypothetical protein
MEAWIRVAVFALIFVLFMRRIFKANAQLRGSRPSSPSAPQTTPSKMRHTFPSNLTRPSGRKNDFRDVPPPPENPELG